jgi:hypothetical protein
MTRYTVARFSRTDANTRLKCYVMIFLREASGETFLIRAGLGWSSTTK